ncbi:MAG: hypothetical protein JO262_18335 [Solirubrobacterales bacterium]|nr:hypothetical protein [Solirubrobacterales bacterium]
MADTADQTVPPGLDQARLARATPEQPLGYRRMRFLWTFIAAIAMFLAGAIFAIGYGTYQLVAGGSATGYLVAYVTLAIALARSHETHFHASQPIMQGVRARFRNEAPMYRY